MDLHNELLFMEEQINQNMKLLIHFNLAKVDVHGILDQSQFIGSICCYLMLSKT